MRMWRNGLLLVGNFSLIGSLVPCVVKILLHCSDALKVKKTLDEEILRCIVENHKRVMLSYSRLWTGESRGSQASCLPSCSSPVMLEWWHPILHKPEDPPNLVLFLIIALLFFSLEFSRFRSNSIFPDYKGNIYLWYFVVHTSVWHHPCWHLSSWCDYWQHCLSLSEVSWLEP